MKGRSAKIGGMGVSKTRNRSPNSIRRAHAFMAPNVPQEQKYGLSADIYSLAFLIWEMWYGRRVFSGNEFDGAISYLFLKVSYKITIFCGHVADNQTANNYLKDLINKRPCLNEYGYRMGMYRLNAQNIF